MSLGAMGARARPPISTLVADGACGCGAQESAEWPEAVLAGRPGGSEVGMDMMEESILGHSSEMLWWMLGWWRVCVPIWLTERSIHKWAFCLTS